MFVFSKYSRRRIELKRRSKGYVSEVSAVLWKVPAKLRPSFIGFGDVVIVNICDFIGTYCVDAQGYR